MRRQSASGHCWRWRSKSIEGATHAVVQRRLERSRVRRSEEKEKRSDEDEDMEAG